MFALFFWKLLVFEFGISETSLCSMSDPQARRASAANAFTREVDVFGVKAVFPNRIL
jgi:hypothetical protein